MDHSEARELLDLAAVEPGGLDRLMAGDTPAAISLAGHLAGCPTCMDEYGRLRQVSAALRDVIATQPPAELRDRTLAFIAAVGRPRGETAAGAIPAPGIDQPPTGAAHVRSRPRVRSRLTWLAVAAALVVASAGASGYAVSSIRDSAARQASLQLEGLAEVATWTVRLDAQPDVRRVVLTAKASGAGTSQVGTLVFSPGSQQLVVVADGLPDPPAGQEYRCWVEVAGARQRLGRMYLSGHLGYWVGDAPAVAAVPAGSVFGVSLADISGSGGASPSILSGTLGAT